MVVFLNSASNYCVFYIPDIDLSLYHNNPVKYVVIEPINRSAEFYVTVTWFSFVKEIKMFEIFILAGKWVTSFKIRSLVQGFKEKINTVYVYSSYCL